MQSCNQSALWCGSYLAGSKSGGGDKGRGTAMEVSGRGEMR